MGCCGEGVILLRLRGSALLRQGLLSEPEASSDPVSMFLADFRSLSSIRRRSPARTAATSPAYGSFHPPHFHPPHKEKDGHPKKRDSRPFLTHHTWEIETPKKNLFVNSVNRITIQKSLDIINRNIHDPLSGSLSSPGDMRSDDAVFSLEKRIIPLDRLSRNNIKTSSINLPTIQSICQILLNNKLTTAVVDKDNSILLPLFARTITSPG